MLAVASRIGQWVLMGPSAMHDHRLCAAFREHRSYRGGRAALRKIGFFYRYQHLPCEKLRVVLRWALVSGFQLASFSISTFWFWAAMARPCTEGIEPILWRPAWKVSYAQLNINDVHVNVMAVHVNVMVPKDVGHSVPWGETWHVLAGLVFLADIFLGRATWLHQRAIVEDCFYWVVICALDPLPLFVMQNCPLNDAVFVRTMHHPRLPPTSLLLLSCRRGLEVSGLESWASDIHSFNLVYASQKKIADPLSRMLSGSPSFCSSVNFLRVPAVLLQFGHIKIRKIQPDILKAIIILVGTVVSSSCCLHPLFEGCVMATPMSTVSRWPHWHHPHLL